MNSTFVWYDLMTTDPAAAKTFYGAVVGYRTEPSPANPAYEMLFCPRGAIGGVMQMPEEAAAMGTPTHWLAYIQVADVAAGAARVLDLGGHIMTRFSIPTVGDVAIFRDPTGGVAALFQPAYAGSTKGGRPEHGEVSWNELATDDLEAAWTFYTGLLGWTKTDEMDMGPGGPYRMYGAPGREGSLGGFFVRPPEMPVSCWTYYITVDDLDAALVRVAEHGGRVLNGPMEVPGGDRVAQCMDPQGGAFALHGFGG